MISPRTLRILAAIVALALPAAAYAGGDAFDAFPGVLTIDKPPAGPAAGPPAVGEAYEKSVEAAPRELAQKYASTHPQSAKELTARLASAAERPVVDGHFAYSVVDARTGTTLVEKDAGTARAPASTMKLITALAAIRSLGPETTFTTSVRVEGTRVSLVGGGDMFLTVAPKETKGGLPRASLAQLATSTAAALKQRKTTEITLSLDDSFFARDPLNPAWKDNGPANGWVAPIMPLGIDGGRLDGTAYGPKSHDPALDATKEFARLLAEQGITVKEPVTRGPALQGKPIAEVRSAPVRSIVEHMLLRSENTLAELLARHVARHNGLPTTVPGARKAVLAELADVAAAEGWSTKGVVIADNSGLSVDNRLPPQLLAHLNAWASTKAPAPVRATFALVPVGGLSGTLASRFDDADASAGRGVVRGKTGYLGGVASLAGTAVLADGTPVGYSILVYGFDGANANEARHAVDAIAAALVSDTRKDNAT